MTPPPPGSSPAVSPASGARLAASQLKRLRRIVDAAVSLAEDGGYEAVRLRDVADAAGVALGTLYKYFRSKEDLLLFAVNEETQRLEELVAARPPAEGSATERVGALFARATRGITRRPDFARAVLRSIAGGGDGVSLQVAGFHLRMTRMIVAALRGEKPELEQPLSEEFGDPHERRLALVLEHVWFASLMAWASGLHPTREVTTRMRDTAELLLGEQGAR